MAESKEYRLKTLLPALSMGLLTVALIMAKTGRDALFFQGEGLFQLPMAYMAIGMTSLPAAFLFVRAMKRWGASPSRIGILIFTAAALALFTPFLEKGNYPVLLSLFVFVPTVFGILFANVWLQASDLFEGAPKEVAPVSFSRIGASALAGGMIGGFLAKCVAPFLEPQWLILLAAGVVLGATAVVVATQRKFPATGSTKEKKFGSGVSVSSVFSKRYARSLLLISMTGALAGLFIDFQFYAAASSAKMGSQGNTNFFANFYIMLNVMSFVLQLFLAPKIQDRVGLQGGLLILPIALLGGATFVSVAATALSRSVLKVTEGGLKSSIHRSIWEQAFIPVDSTERSFVKMFVDGIGARVAEGIGATALFIWLSGMEMTDPAMLNTQWMAWVLLVTAVLWLLLTRGVRTIPTEEVSEALPAAAEEDEQYCTRFPDQCPCTTEMGKGIR